jgi:hypothetical protein
MIRIISHGCSERAQAKASVYSTEFAICRQTSRSVHAARFGLATCFLWISKAVYKMKSALVTGANKVIGIEVA